MDPTGAIDDPAMNEAETAPVAVWDVREARWWPLQEERCAWLRAAVPIRW